MSPGRTVPDLGRPRRPRRRSSRPGSRIVGLVLAALLVPLALVLTTAAPANAETCLLASAEKGCIVGTIRTEVDVVPDVDIIVDRAQRLRRDGDDRRQGQVERRHHRDRRLHRDDRRGDLAQGHRRRRHRPPRSSHGHHTWPRPAGPHLRRPHRRVQRHGELLRPGHPQHLQRHPARAAPGAGLHRAVPDLRDDRSVELRPRRAGDHGRHARVPGRQPVGRQPVARLRAGRDLLRVHRLGSRTAASGSRCDGAASGWRR